MADSHFDPTAYHGLSTTCRDYADKHGVHHHDPVDGQPYQADSPDESRVTFMADTDSIDLACEVMHDAYERAAVGAGWDTNPASRKPWADVPEPNKVTMRAAVSALLADLDVDRLRAECDALRAERNDVHADWDETLDALGATLIERDALAAQVKAVRAAWLNAGPEPRYHAAVRAEVSRMWPTLARAVEALCV